MTALPPAPATTTRSLTGSRPFVGEGLEHPLVLDDDLVYRVPPGAGAHVASFRGGNSSAELVVVLLLADGAPLGYYPIGAGADVHVAGAPAGPDLRAGQVLELRLSAPRGAWGEVVVELCVVEGGGGPDVPVVAGGLARAG